MKIGELSGSLTRLLDDTSYLIAGTNITIVSESNGAITISSTGGGGSGDDFFDSTTAGSIFTSGSTAFVGVDEFGVVSSPLDKGTDVFFYVSGSIGSKDGVIPGVSLFGGDVVVSGSLTIPSDAIELTGSLLVTGRVEVTGTLEATQGLSGSLTNLVDGTSYLIAGTNITITSQSNGSVTISNTFTQTDDFFDSTVQGSIYTSGSAAFVGSGEFGVVTSPTDKAADVFFYVSGSIGSKHTSVAGTALFGGDVTVSGSFYTDGNLLEVQGKITATEGISGSLTQLVDGTSYLIAGQNISISSQSNGSITISNTFQQVDDFFDSTVAGSIFTTGSTAFKGQESITSPQDKGTDVFFYVSGSIGSKGGTDPGVAVFEGDVVISGSVYTEGNKFEMTGTLEVTNGISGSLTKLIDGTSYLVAGQNITISSESNGSVTISNTFQQVDDFFDSTTAGSIFTTGSTAFVGSGEFGVIDSPADKGTDVFFYVSGSIGSKNSTDPGVSLFGGDIVVSGSVFAEGSKLEITGTLEVTNGISGSLTKLSDGTSYLLAGNNIAIVSQSNGSIIISSSTPTLVYRPGGVDTDNVYSSWSALMSAFDQLEGIVTIDIDTSVTSPATVPVGTYDFESRVILRGTQTGFVNPSRLQMPDGAVIKNPREFENIWLDMLATTTPNFDIDVDDRAIKFSGVSYIEMNGTQPFADITAALTLGVSFQFRDAVIINNYSPSNRCFLSINNASANVTLILIDNVILNNDNLIAGTVGSLYIYHDSSIGTNFLIGLPTNPNFSGTTTLLPLDNAKLIAYDDIFAGTTELSASTVQVAIDVLKERWSSAVGNNLFTTSSIAIKGNELGIDTASDKGTDVFFYVSGSISGNGTEDSKTLFGGDVVVSGSLSLGSGSNLPTGIVFLDGGNPGTAVVNNSLVNSTSMIFLTKQANSNTTAGPVVVSSKTNGSFTITSNFNGDSDPVAYLIINPSNS